MPRSAHAEPVARILLKRDEDRQSADKQQAYIPLAHLTTQAQKLGGQQGPAGLALIGINWD
eukprot:SAG31_NODE_2080_length_6493_cov_3.638255_4_plen_61_part_00